MIFDYNVYKVEYKKLPASKVETVYVVAPYYESVNEHFHKLKRELELGDRCRIQSCVPVIQNVYPLHVEEIR